MEKGKLAFVRKDIISGGSKVPVGDKYYGSEKPLEYKWEGEKFLVKLDGKWLEAESVDWEFEKGGAAGAKKMPTWNYTAGAEWSPNQVLELFREYAKKKYDRTLDEQEEIELMEEAKEQVGSGLDIDNVLNILEVYFGSEPDGGSMEKGGKVTSKDLLDKLKAGEKISENEVLLIKNRMNNNRKDEHSDELIQWIWDNQPELTSEQNKKGHDFLMNLWKSPTGKIRSGSPFGTREENALETFKYFTLDGFHDISRYGGRSFYVPIYSLVGDKGSFQYYYDGKVNIIGAKGGEMGKSSASKNKFSMKDFWSSYANDGALITGGGYSNREKKEFGGFLLGLGVGSIGGYVYRDQISKAKEKAKWKTIEAIDRLEKGGEAGNLSADEKSAIKSHLSGMGLKSESANKVISMLNDVRSGDRYMGDMVADTDVTIGDIVDSLRLNEFVPAEVMGKGGSMATGGGVDSEKKKQIMSWLKNIASNYNDGTDTNIISQLYDMANELGLNKNKIDYFAGYFEAGDKVTAEGIYQNIISPSLSSGGSMATGGGVDEMTERDFLNKYFGSNVFPQEVTDRFEIRSKSISDEDKAKEYIEQLKAEGFSVKKKSYSMFTAIMGAKLKSSGGSMATGGGVRPASAIARERKYTARGQKHEMNYKDSRKSRIRYYKKGD